ncbi:outer membrane lipoprotein-sorting protein [Desulfogranum marinum]|uniref:outer membrane lipoprotein-sorting protein n=1 Tax=Desulfogranum marinum TaxID=453220 RepID=UPI0029C7D926|nr:outer membrane lipoprotein-sorting protein [Desulfogranum marinum]
MQRKFLFSTPLLIATLLLALVAPVWGIDGNELLRQVDARMQPASYEMYRKLINVEPDGSKKEFVLYTVKKGQEKMVALFVSPASEKGRATLRLGDNMWLYIPNVGKPLRITSLQSVVGGVFNNSDILRLDYSVEYTAESVEDKGDSYLLELKAKSGAVAYDRLMMVVDKKTTLPTTIECYAVSGMLIKTLHYSKIKDFGDGMVRPSVLETDSPLYKGYKSVMLFAKMQQREFDDEVFTLNYMSKVDALR